MEFENLLTLIKTVSDSDLTDFAYEENGTSIHLKKKKETVVVTGNSSNVPVMGLQTVQPLSLIHICPCPGKKIAGHARIACRYLAQ